MKRRPLIFWTLLVASVAVTVWWAFHVPARPRDLYRAIPAQATWLTAHHDLAGRWETLRKNPLTTSVALALGADPEEWDEQAVSPDTQRFLDTLAANDVFLAYVPEMRITGRPAWVFSAWLGGGSQRLRWTLKSMKDPNLRRASSRNGWHVWVWTPKGMKHGERITFSIVEGMLVGCIAADTLGIEDVLACYDGHLPSLADRPELQVAPPQDALDRGWVRTPGAPTARPPVRYTLKLSPSGSLAGTVFSPSRPPQLLVPPPQGSVDEFSDLVRAHPAAGLVVHRALAAHWLQQAFTNPVGREVAAYVQSYEPGAVALALLGGKYSGRFMAVRLPTLMASVPTLDAGHAVLALHKAFDRLNAATPWGLVPQTIRIDTQRVYAIESTGRSTYADLEEKERIAYVPFARSVVFSSNLETLQKLLAEAASAPPAEPGRMAQGIQRMRDQHALGYLWMDLEEGAKIMRLAVTAWSLKLLIEDPRASQATRQRLNDAKAWIDTLAPLKTLHLWARPVQDGLEYEFQLGAPDEAAPPAKEERP